MAIDSLGHINSKDKKDSNPGIKPSDRIDS